MVFNAVSKRFFLFPDGRESGSGAACHIRVERLAKCTILVDPVALRRAGASPKGHLQVRHRSCSNIPSQQHLEESMLGSYRPRLTWLIESGNCMRTSSSAQGRREQPACGCMWTPIMRQPRQRQVPLQCHGLLCIMQLCQGETDWCFRLQYTSLGMTSHYKVRPGLDHLSHLSHSCGAKQNCH